MTKIQITLSRVENHLLNLCKFLHNFSSKEETIKFLINNLSNDSPYSLVSDKLKLYEYFEPQMIEIGYKLKKDTDTYHHVSVGVETEEYVSSIDNKKFVGHHDVTVQEYPNKDEIQKTSRKNKKQKGRKKPKTIEKKK